MPGCRYCGRKRAHSFRLKPPLFHLCYLVITKHWALWENDNAFGVIKRVYIRFLLRGARDNQVLWNSYSFFLTKSGLFCCLDSGAVRMWVRSACLLFISTNVESDIFILFGALSICTIEMNQGPPFSDDCLVSCVCSFLATYRINNTSLMSFRCILTLVMKELLDLLTTSY